MKKKEIRAIFEQLKEGIGIEEKVSLRFVPFKRKKASVSLRKKEVRLNSALLKVLCPEEVRIILAHELLHLKYGVYHSREFEEALKRYEVGNKK